ncbi:MAG: enoyl-CoA hydratase [Acidobacteriota bacterium]|nr:enoyl-CoA hydratase [Blastocatellia bacterium]MDW8412867.1 enoyl-CoA hydratase [Acidobacteriota bacterium]
MLVLTEREDKLLRITLNRPQKLNALFANMRELLLDALEEAASDDGVQLVVITGAGRAFCAGGDVSYMAELRRCGDVEGFKRLLELGRRIVIRIRTLPKPVVAVINGVAAGAGLSLALACDLRIASQEASFAQSFVKLGLHPDWGSSLLLPQLVGTSTACRLIFTGEVIDAYEALKLRLVDAVYPAEDLPQAVTSLSQKLLQAAPRSVALAKRSIYAATGAELEAALDREEKAQLECFLSDDAQEGIEAFLERRRPVFTGR